MKKRVSFVALCFAAQGWHDGSLNRDSIANRRHPDQRRSPRRSLTCRGWAWGCVLLIGLNACAPPPRVLTVTIPAQGVLARTIRASSDDGSLVVTVHPYETPEGEKKIASGTSGQTNIIPVAIFLDKESEGVSVVRWEEMSLELSDGSRLFATDPQYVTVVRGPVQKKSGGGSGGGFFPMGGGGGAAAALGIIVLVVALGVVVWYLAHKAPPGKEVSEFTDQFITLEKGQSAQGIVFFVTPQGSAGIDRATLRVPFASDFSAATPKGVVTVQLTDLEVLTLNPTGVR